MRKEERIYKELNELYEERKELEDKIESYENELNEYEEGSDDYEYFEGEIPGLEIELEDLTMEICEKEEEYDVEWERLKVIQNNKYYRLQKLLSYNNESIVNILNKNINKLYDRITEHFFLTSDYIEFCRLQEEHKVIQEEIKQL